MASTTVAERLLVRFLAGFAALIFVAAFDLLLALPVQAIWNVHVRGLFGGPRMTWWETWCLLLGLGIVARHVTDKVQVHDRG